jgi:hypothetical protein
MSTNNQLVFLSKEAGTSRVWQVQGSTRELAENDASHFLGAGWPKKMTFFLPPCLEEAGGPFGSVT